MAFRKRFNENHGFNTQPPEGGWHIWCSKDREKAWFQHTAARRRLETAFVGAAIYGSFNTQPPEGGWNSSGLYYGQLGCFNTQPPEGGWINSLFAGVDINCVSTHSRPKAAGASLKSLAPSGFSAPISLNSQEKRECEYNTAFSVTPAFAIS